MDTSKELTSKLIADFPAIQAPKTKEPPPPKGFNLNPVFILENGFYFSKNLDEAHYAVKIWIEDEKVYANLHKHVGYLHYGNGEKIIKFEKFELLYSINMQKQQMHFNMNLDAIDLEHDNRILANGFFVLNMDHLYPNYSKNIFLRYPM